MTAALAVCGPWVALAALAAAYEAGAFALLAFLDRVEGRR